MTIHILRGLLNVIWMFTVISFAYYCFNKIVAFFEKHNGKVKIKIWVVNGERDSKHKN